MAKTLRVKTRAGWVTKPTANIPDNWVTPEEIDDNFLTLEDDILQRIRQIDYTAGLEIDSYRLYVRDGDDVYALSESQALPYTTTGLGMPEGGAFVYVGDHALREELVQPVATYNSAADMTADATLTVGRKVRTLGYYTTGDGGGNDYEIVAAATGTDDGGSFIDLSGSGLQAKGLFVDGVVNVKQFGASTDGNKIQTALDSHGKLIASHGEYILSNLTIMDQHLEGESKEKTILKCSTDGRFITIGGNGKLSNLTIDLDNKVSIGAFLTSFESNAGRQVDPKLENVRIINSGKGATTSITNITNGNETTVTAPGHDLSNGDLVEISGVNGLFSSTNPSRSLMTDTYVVYGVSGDTFKVSEDVSTKPVNSSGYSSYVSGGVAKRVSYAVVIGKNDDYSSSRDRLTSLNNVEFESNYGHLAMFDSFRTSLKDVRMKGNTEGYAIHFGLNARELLFDNLYTESGFFFRTGVRDIEFNGLKAWLSNDWQRPLLDAIGINSSFGNAGGEVAGIRINGFQAISRSNIYTGPFFSSNSNQLLIKNGITRCRESSNWVWGDLTGIQCHLEDLTFESVNPWFLTDPNKGTGLHCNANGLWYTQGVVGLATWGASRYAGTNDMSHITVKSSNLNHQIVSGGLGGTGYTFEQIRGDIDLTNAKRGGTVLSGVSGTVIDPLKAALFVEESEINIGGFVHEFNSVNGAGLCDAYSVNRTHFSSSLDLAVVDLSDASSSATAYIKTVATRINGGASVFDLAIGIHNSSGTLVQSSPVVNTTANPTSGISSPSVSWDVNGTVATLRFISNSTAVQYFSTINVVARAGAHINKV